MWTKEVLGTDIYHILGCFAIYSILGWTLESIYMSFCNRKLTNRGFGKGPFCPIYGFGAIIGYMILQPFHTNKFAVYVVAAIAATTFEFLVGKLMIRLFGQLWWDYNEKPVNYKGIICLESTIAWGFYGLGIVYFVHGWVNKMIDKVQMNVGISLICIFFLIATIDYMIQFYKVLHLEDKLPWKTKNADE